MKMASSRKLFKRIRKEPIIRAYVNAQTDVFKSVKYAQNVHISKCDRRWQSVQHSTSGCKYLRLLFGLWWKHCLFWKL